MERTCLNRNVRDRNLEELFPPCFCLAAGVGGLGEILPGECGISNILFRRTCILRWVTRWITEQGGSTSMTTRLSL